MEFLKSPVVLAFIPLFVAIDVMGLLPVFVGLTQGMSEPDRRRTVRIATITAILVASLFILLGNEIFRFLSVTVDDFRIAGGILLLVFAIQDLFVGGKPRRTTSPTFAVVPLGMPLIVGPAVLTTSLLMVQQNGYAATFSALGANLAIVFLALRFSDQVLRIIGPGVAAATAKVASLFLAVIGVMMLRLGILNTVEPLLRR